MHHGVDKFDFEHNGFGSLMNQSVIFGFFLPFCLINMIGFYIVSISNQNAKL